jgi:hypothetical protein
MNKHLFTLLIVASGIQGLNAQLSKQNGVITKNPYEKRTAEMKINLPQDNGSFPTELFQTINPTVAAPASVNAASQTIIGQTVYDLQTNNAVQNRLMNYGAGNGVSAIWTFGNVQPAFPERGMAYQHINGSGELVNPTALNSIARIENLRTGFGSLSRIQNGVEVVISHATAGSNLVMTKNSGVGSTNWTPTLLPFSVDVPQLWPRMTIGGNDGKTIHTIAVTAPVALQGTPYQGIDGALVYSRSLDGGQTWDITNQVLPGMDSTKYKAFSGDEYAIASRGNVVAFVYGGFRKDWVLMKSTDNGNTWTKRIILPFPVDAFDDTQLLDTTEVSDGGLSLVIDNNDVVHTSTGRMRILNQTLDDGSITYFPGTTGILYWNELFPGNSLPEIVAGLVDEDGDGQVNIVLYPAGGVPAFQASTTSFTSMSIDANNHLILTYAAIKENTEFDGRGYRNLYAIKSEDGGQTFTEPVNITPFDDFTEYMYGYMPERLGSNLEILYMSDESPGIATVPAENNPITYHTNFIVYQTQPLSEIFLSTPKVQQVSHASVFPNPAVNKANLTFELTSPSAYTIEVYSITGQRMIVNSTQQIATGQQNVELNTTDLASGVYLIKISTSTSQITKKLIIKK